MGLAQVQEVLAQIYTNTQLRERYFHHPQAVGEELGLSYQEALQLAELSQQQVNVFANSLKWKRLGEVREMLPRTAKLLGKEFNSLFWRYAETQIPEGIKKHHQDAIAFANFIIKVADNEVIEPAWIVDVVNYEKTWLLVYQTNTCFYIRWFNYAIHQDYSKKRAIAIWLRLRKNSPLYHSVRWATPYLWRSLG